MPQPRPASPRPTGNFGPDHATLQAELTAQGIWRHLTRDRPTLIGLRFSGQEPGAAPGVPVNRWNDCLGVLVPQPDGSWVWVKGRGTTEPGRAPIERTGGVRVHSGGVARIRPGLYRRSHGGGFHRHDRDRPAFRHRAPLVDVLSGRPGTERWTGTRWQSEGVDPVQWANFHSIPPALPVKTALKNGVNHGSQACPVVLDPVTHRLILTAGGWTEDTEGCVLDLLIVVWPGPLRPLHA